MRKILSLAEGRFSPLSSKTANAAHIYLPGEVIAIITEWQGRPVSANFPIQVKFPEKLKVHLREDELEII